MLFWHLDCLEEYFYQFPFASSFSTITIVFFQLIPFTLLVSILLIFALKPSQLVFLIQVIAFAKALSYSFILVKP
jgi:hypothetical protein